MPILEVRRLEERGVKPRSSPSASLKERYQKALALLERIADEASTRFTTYEQRRISGVSSILDFVRTREDSLRKIRIVVDREVEYQTTTITKGNGDVKERIIGRCRQLIENVFYNFQFYLASIPLPEATEGGQKTSAFTEPFALAPTPEVNQELGKFLRTLGITNKEFMQAVQDLREILLPANTEDIQPNKNRIAIIARYIVSAYIDFRLAGQPMTEGLQ